MAIRAHGETKKIYMNQKWANMSCVSTSKSGSKRSEMRRTVITIFLSFDHLAPMSPFESFRIKIDFFGLRKKNALYDQSALEENNWFFV